MKEVLFINGKREGYGIDQCNNTLTVGELIEILESYEEDTEIYLKNDNGYTYGSITHNDIYGSMEGEEEEEEEEGEY